MLKAEYQTRGPRPEAVIDAVPLSLPPLAAGQVLLKVLAAPINPSDLLTLTGEYGMLPPLPAVGGNEGVGRVAELGPEVSHLKAGQLVLLPVGQGTWCSHMIADARRVIPLPEGDPQQLSMLTVNPPTAALLLSEFVKLGPGDWVIQNAANSGVGGYLIQLARQRGFKTVNLVRRESALADIAPFGGDVNLVDGPDLARRVKQATGGAPIRLGIDAVGGEATERMGGCLADSAVLVNYGRMSGESCRLSPNALIFRGISLQGFWLARWFQQASPAEQQKLFAEIGGLVANGTLHARVAGTYPLERIKDAVVAAAQGERDGKILVVPA